MDNFSNFMMIGECLLDKRRTSCFSKAISKTVKKGDIVLDSGTGSGILAMLSAKAGARKVYAVEVDPVIADVARKNVEKNGFGDVIEVINKDIKQIVLPEKLDVVTMEMLDTGLVAEQQVMGMNNLISMGLVTDRTSVIPGVFETYIQFADYDFNLYGFDFPFIIQARNFGVLKNVRNKGTDLLKINSFDLSKVNDVNVNYKGSFNSGIDMDVNSIILTSRIKLASGIYCWGTSDMNMPVIVPIPTKSIMPNEDIAFGISYKTGYGFGEFKFSWAN